MEEKINLLELKNGIGLPDFVYKENLVYCCKNLVNGKVYVGETSKSLLERWSWHIESIPKKRNQIIYGAIRKYGIENFEVSILECGFNSEVERKERERFWIKELKSFVEDENSNGYNMTIGGDGTNLSSKSSRKKMVKTMLKKYGQMPFNSKEAQEKALKTNRERNGGKLAFQSEKSRLKGQETQRKKNDGLLAIELPETRKKALEAYKKKYNGKFPFNSKNVLDKAQKLAPLYRMIGCIERHINVLKEKNIEINASNYVYETDDKHHMWQQHVPHILNRIEELRKLEKWTQDMENIFSNIEYINENKGINKIKIKNL